MDSKISGPQLGLDIGCGTQKNGTMIGLDFRRVGGVDIVADARSLPFRNESIDLVFSSHTIEHFSHLEVHDILAEWVRVLKRKGTLEIRCPDLRARAFLYSLRPNWENMKYIYGAQDFVGNFHQSGFSYRTMKRILGEVGIAHVKRIVRGYKGIPFLPDSLHIRGLRD